MSEMLDLRECIGCKWLHDSAIPECRFKGWCPYRYTGKPMGYQTPEDSIKRDVIRREVRNADR